MISGYLIALLTAENRPLRQFTRSVVFAPVVIGLGASSLLWYWLFSYDFGLINRALMDLGVIAKPVVWFGADADVALWAVIVSIVWKVVGFGTILFVAAIHAVPSEIGEAAMVDGASYWQRVRRITLPLTAKTILLVTLVSVIGSLLAFDQFYIMTAGQPRNLTATSVFMIYSEFVPLPEARIRRGAVADPGRHHPDLHCSADAAQPQEPRMSAFPDAAVRNQPSVGRATGSGLLEGLIKGRRKYLVAAMCVAICTIMLLPLVASVLASLKSTVEAAAVPPTYFPHSLSLDSYERLWNYQAGLPTYFSNSLGAAALTIFFCLALTVPAGYGLAKFRIPARRRCSSCSCSA